MTVHRIDLRPDLRKEGHGKTPMLYNGKVIGSSDQPEYAAARWLLDNNAAMPEDKLETYRGEVPCMSGAIGQLAKWTIEETKHGNPTFKLRRWKALEIAEVRSPAPETHPPVHPVLEPPVAAKPVTNAVLDHFEKRP